MVPDEPQEDDTVFNERGLTFVIKKDLLEEIKPVKVDFVTTPMGEGFHISTGNQKSCGSCSC